MDSRPGDQLKPTARNRLGGALPRWIKPRLGELTAQHQPRPLRVPRAYAAARPPKHAPGIGIVTPSLNQGEFIGAAIDSVLGQDYPALDYLVADGGSKDETAAVLSLHTRAGFRAESKPDGGPAAAINEAHERTDGELMAWLNADDMLLPGSLAYVASYFANHPKVDLVYGNRIFIDERGGEVGTWVTPRHSTDSLRWFDFIPQETMFWRRATWREIGGLDAGLAVAYDWDFLARAHQHGAAMVRLPRFLGCMRLHGGQLSRVRADVALRELEGIRTRLNGRNVDLTEAKSRADRFRIRSLGHHFGQAALRGLTPQSGPAGPGGDDMNASAD